MKFISLDIETTGLDTTAKDAMILSVGMIVDNLEVQAPYEELPKIHIMVNPSHRTMRGNIKAISMNSDLINRMEHLESLRVPGGINAGEVEGVSIFTDSRCSYLEYFLFEREDAGFQIQHFMQKNFPQGERVLVAGKNAGSFDLPFIASTWSEHITTLRPQHATMDPAILYMLPGDVKVPHLSLCKERAGFPDVEVAHNALADAWDVCRLLRHKFPIKKVGSSYLIS